MDLLDDEENKKRKNLKEGKDALEMKKKSSYFNIIISYIFKIFTSLFLFSFCF